MNSKYLVCPYQLGGYVIRPADWEGEWECLKDDGGNYLDSVLVAPSSYTLRYKHKEVAECVCRILNQYANLEGGDMYGKE